MHKDQPEKDSKKNLASSEDILTKLRDEETLHNKKNTLLPQDNKQKSIAQDVDTFELPPASMGKESDPPQRSLFLSDEIKSSHKPEFNKKSPVTIPLYLSPFTEKFGKRIAYAQKALSKTLQENYTQLAKEQITLLGKKSNLPPEKLQQLKTIEQDIDYFMKLENRYNYAQTAREKIKERRVDFKKYSSLYHQIKSKQLISAEEYEKFLTMDAAIQTLMDEEHDPEKDSVYCSC